jgi:sulfhydrogenase subunit beta (sulfur reductase)
VKLKPAILSKKDFEPFLKGLTQDYDLYAPVRLADGVSVLKKVEPSDTVDLSSNPQKGLKEAFFPQSEVMFRYDRAEDGHRVNPPDPIAKDRVVLGSRPCDVQALSILDDVFLGKEYTDVYYQEKRERTTLLSLACPRPCSTCFCSSLGGGPFNRNGSDVLLVDLGDSYLVEFLTEKSSPFRKNGLLRDATPEEVRLARNVEERASKKADGSDDRESLLEPGP